LATGNTEHREWLKTREELKTVEISEPDWRAATKLFEIDWPASMEISERELDDRTTM